MLGNGSISSKLFLVCVFIIHWVLILTDVIYTYWTKQIRSSKSCPCFEFPLVFKLLSTFVLGYLNHGALVLSGVATLYLTAQLKVSVLLLCYEATYK